MMLAHTLVGWEGDTSHMTTRCPLRRVIPLLLAFTPTSDFLNTG